MRVILVISLSLASLRLVHMHCHAFDSFIQVKRTQTHFHTCTQYTHTYAHICLQTCSHNIWALAHALANTHHTHTGYDYLEEIGFNVLF